MRYFGVDTALVTSRQLHNPTEQKLLALFEALLVEHLPRLERAGIRAFAALGIHPRAMPRRGVSAVLQALPGWCRGGKVVAIGEIGLEHGGPDEEELLLEQLALARTLQLPVIATASHEERDRHDPKAARAAPREWAAREPGPRREREREDGEADPRGRTPRVALAAPR